VLRIESSLWCRIGPVLSPVPGLDGGAEARGDGDTVVVAVPVKAEGAVHGRDRDPGGELGEDESGVFRDVEIGERIEERGEIVRGGVEGSPLGNSAILPIPNTGLDTEEDPDGNPFVDILGRPSRPLGTSRISLSLSSEL
jgi:hypothetical protein